MKLRIFAFLLAASLFVSAADKLPLLPYPKQVEQKDGEFVILNGTRIVLTAKNAKADKVAAEMLADEIRSAADLKVSVGSSAGIRSITLRRLDTKDFPKLEGTDAERFKAEGYVID